jgi:cytochrome bd-type quinol oxidase subunit 2
MSTRVVALYRKAFLLAVGVVIACMPWLWLAERFGWSQRPIHWVQTFLAVPIAGVASVLFLWASRSEAGSRGLRAWAWVVFVTAFLWVAFVAYVLWFADFSWMNQR